MRTVQEIFDKAIHLIDAQNESTGSTHTTDTREYEVRCCECLNTLLNEAYPYSDTYMETLDSFDATADYAVGDKAAYQKGRYRCIQNCPAALSVTPENTAYWLSISKPGKRPVHPPVNAMTDTVDMDDFICMSALPAGLAALFTFDEDQAKYNAFWGDYMNRLAQARATLPASDGFEDIDNPYGWDWDHFSGGIEYGEFGRW